MFFDAQDKPAYLHQLLSNLLDAKTDSNLDQNLIKFIILQSLNYYDSQKNSKEGINILENFFTQKKHRIFYYPMLCDLFADLGPNIACYK